MRARYNETTAHILRCLLGGPKTVEEVSKECGSKYTTAGSILLRLFKQKSVVREKVKRGWVVIDRKEKVKRPRYVYLYEIAPKGRGRLRRIDEA
jgi:predicted transcriptional regulator